MKASSSISSPITRDLEISRAAASLPVSLAKLEGAFEGPIVGYLIDRFGPRSMVVAGGFLSGLGFVLLSFTHSYIVFLLVFVLILSVGFKAGYNHAMLASINTWFIRRKGLAMSFVSTGSAVGGLVITPLIAFVVFTMGWRTAALMSGLAIWLIVIPLALVVKRSPESMGLLPDGDRPRRSLAGTPSRRVSPPTSGFEYTVRQAARTPAFWMFAMAHSFRNVGHGGIFVHLVPVLVWKGVQEEDTTFYIVFMLFTIMAMRLFMGWMGDVWSRQKVAALGVSLGIVGMGLLAFSSGRWWELTLFVFLFGTSGQCQFHRQRHGGGPLWPPQLCHAAGLDGLDQQLSADGRASVYRHRIRPHRGIQYRGVGFLRLVRSIRPSVLEHPQAQASVPARPGPVPWGGRNGWRHG